jgi:dTMP kinase
MFITFEGPEGSGKTTQTPLLTDYLKSCGLNVLQIREPGGTPIGDQIRQVLHDLKNDAMHPHTELLLYSASRAQVVAERLRPHLEQDGIVICDRYADSTLAYQGYGRGLDLEALKLITHFATGGLKPDLTLFLDIDPEQGLQRRLQNNEEWNRMDSQTLDFYLRVHHGYLKLIEADPGRWVRINASQSVEQVRDEIRAVVDGWIAQRK